MKNNIFASLKDGKHENRLPLEQVKVDFAEYVANQEREAREKVSATVPHKKQKAEGLLNGYEVTK